MSSPKKTKGSVKTPAPAQSNKFQDLRKSYQKDVENATDKYKALKDLDIFVLDNSIRESTVGQLKGHTIDDKWKIFEEVKKCGFKHTIVASFSQMARVDDLFIEQLCQREKDKSGMWAFSEITEGIKKNIPDFESVPVGIRKLKKVGLYNVIFEVDLSDAVYDFTKVKVEQICMLVKKWVKWVHENLHKTDAKITVSLRDLPDCMPSDSDRVFQFVDFLCKMHKQEKVRLFGLMFEEPKGLSLPEECATWAKYIRKIMHDNKWEDGHLLVHVHQKFGYCDATALEVLMNGATGIWASVCIEGSSMGNASSCVTLLNLIRLGNKKVLKRYNCTYLRQAAIKVTQITTGQDPHIKQPIYGARACDFVFNLSKDDDNFDLAEFFGEKAPVRITTLSSPEMIRTRLVNLFGENRDFTVDRAYKMKELMLQDLKSNRKEEYMSKCGLAVLFDRAGGSLTEEMRDIIANDPIKSPHAQNLIKQIREKWDEWDLREGDKDDNLNYDSFYNAFMAPYFGCYRCHDTKKGLSAIDMDSDGTVDWNEFKVYLMYGIKQYPECKTTDDLLDVVFRKAVIPAMRDEIVAKQCKA